MGITSSILSITDEAQGVKTFEIEKPEGFDFLPGQYCWVSLPGFKASPMALASGNNEAVLKFSIRAWGDLTKALLELSTGDNIIIDGPYGTAFPVDRVINGQQVTLIAGGTGITPIRSVVQSLQRSDVQVLYGARTPDEMLYRDEIEGWEAKVTLTIDTPHNEWNGQTGLVTELLLPESINDTKIFFVCGPKPMEAAVVQHLRKLGAHDDNIYVSLEKFDTNGNVVGPVLPVTDERVEFS